MENQQNFLKRTKITQWRKRDVEERKYNYSILRGSAMKDMDIVVM